MTETRREFKEPILVMWLNKSKDGAKQYLSGVDGEKNKFVGFINGKKKNPKEPDIRVYVPGEEKLEEVGSLWVNVSKKGKKYISGKFKEIKIVGFINSKATVGGKAPYFSLYESRPKEDAAEGEQVEMNTGADGVPF